MNKTTHREIDNKLSHPTLSYLEQEYQESLIQGKIHIQKKVKQNPRILVKLNFRDLCDLKLSDFHAFDSMAIKMNQKRDKNWKG